MTKRLLIVGAALVTGLLMFEVKLDVRLQWPHEVERLDPRQEAKYTDCMMERNRIVHRETFAAIDNPDVQREVLAARMAEAAAECRARFPENRATERRPFEFNLIDLKPRF